MKTIVLLLLISISSRVSAQTKTQTEKVHSETKQSIKDDGKTLTISINGEKNGQKFQFDKKILVKGMNQSQKDAIVKRITDSLGVYHPNTK